MGEVGPRQESDALSLDSLPKTALQAIYHAVTGKTESMSKSLRGNVLVTSADFDRLYQMLREQMGHYTLLAEPTVTVVVKCDSSRTVTYSS
jgi:hypothetical protein